MKRIVTLLLLFILYTYADLPIHCNEWHVQGEWKFYKVFNLDSDLCGRTRPDDIITPYINDLTYNNLINSNQEALVVQVGNNSEILYCKEGEDDNDCERERERDGERKNKSTLIQLLYMYT